MAQRYGDPLGPMLSEYARTGDPDLREAIIGATLDLVEHVAQRFRFSGEPYEDLLQEGRIGLLNAVEMFDTDRGVKFATYASHVVQGAIQHYLRDKGKLIREPGWLHDLNQKVNKAGARLRQRLGREPDAAELAADLHLPEAQVAEVLRTRDVFRVSSLEQPFVDDETGGGYDEERHNNGATNGEAILPLVDKLALQEAIDNLREVERQVVQDFFFSDLSKSAIAARTGYSPSQVSQILRRALRSMRDMLLTGEAAEAPAGRRALRSELETVVRGDDEPTVRDPLTGLFTMDYLRERLNEELARSRMHRYELSICLLGLAGRFAGERPRPESERLLVAVAEVLGAASRRSDLVGRYDDQRFIFVLPETGSSASVLAERCRQRLAQRLQPLELRAGIAVYPATAATAEVLLSAAEQALAAAVSEQAVVIAAAARLPA